MKYDVVLIGGGLSSLVCGISLQRAGKRCLMVSGGQNALHFSSGAFGLLGGEIPTYWFIIIAGVFTVLVVIALATRYSPLPAHMLRLVSAVIVALALALPAFKEHLGTARLRKGGTDDA